MDAKCLLKNDKGAVLVIAMLVLLLLTLMGRGAITTSSLEMGIAGNERCHNITFYTAEAGIEHIKAMLQTEFTIRNRAKIASGQNPDWDFALNGTVEGIDAATDTNFIGGAVWVNNQALGDGAGLSCNYTVTVWNNPADRGGITNDTDRLLCIRSVAADPGGTTSNVEVVLIAQASGEAITGYFGQDAAGSGRNNNSRDVRAISDFSIQ